LSGGVGALVTDAWDLRGDARYLQARAVRDDNPDLLRVAATLLASARQGERDSWELASREAAARAKASPALPPWFVQAPAAVSPRPAETVSSPPPAEPPPDDETPATGQGACPGDDEGAEP